MPLPAQRHPRSQVRTTPIPPSATYLDQGGRGIYDLAYIHRLRALMRKSLLDFEQASADYNSLAEQHKDRTGDPGRLLKNRDSDPLINDAYKASIFHRDTAAAYAAILQAELMAWKPLQQEMQQ